MYDDCRWYTNRDDEVDDISETPDSSSMGYQESWDSKFVDGKLFGPKKGLNDVSPSRRVSSLRL